MRNPKSESNVWWGGSSPNIPLSDPSFLANRGLALEYLLHQDRLYIQDGFVNWGPEVRALCRVLISIFQMLITTSSTCLQTCHGASNRLDVLSEN